MIDYEIQRLSEENKYLVDYFTCVESDEDLENVKSRDKKRIKVHSKDMDRFLREEAWDDQEKGVSTTFLFIVDSKLAAYISLCNDAIQLDFSERKDMDLSYTTEPAVKIARLAVDNAFKGKGLGKEAIQYAVATVLMIREQSGAVFLTLDCYKHRVSYYEGIGFVRNEIQPIELEYDSPTSMRLWIDNYLQGVG